jgi:hypothetical protein
MFEDVVNMDSFYNKEIKIYTYYEYKDDRKINKTGYTLATEPILVDIQPYSSQKSLKDYGYDIETTKRMFCDIIDYISEENIIKYRNQYYKIQKIIEWDDYYSVLLLETEIENVHEEMKSNG